MERITAHQFSREESIENQLNITAVGKPGIRHGAYNEYRVEWFRRGELENVFHREVLTVNFQSAPVPNVGVNGVTIEALLAICAHRLECFQGGEFPCEENAEALQHIEAALQSLHNRTDRRMNFGYEGRPIEEPYEPKEEAVSHTKKKAAPPTETVTIDTVVSRFLGWKFPTDFGPDGGISLDKEYLKTFNSWPTGTNLLNYEQAKQMFEYCISGSGEDSKSIWNSFFGEKKGNG